VSWLPACAIASQGRKKTPSKNQNKVDHHNDEPFVEKNKKKAMISNYGDPRASCLTLAHSPGEKKEKKKPLPLSLFQSPPKSTIKHLHNHPQYV
jgi:hypothetical protein